MRPLAAVLLVLVAGCVAARQQRIVYADGTVEVVGLEVDPTLQMEVAVNGETTPMLGVSDGVRFRPRFPLTPGLTYRVSYGLWHGTFTVPAAPPEPPTHVTGIYPSADSLPENQLKFYIVFSASMGLGDAAQHVRLVDVEHGPVDLPFLELDEELWDPEQRRLTLFIDPGRIKHGVRPLEEVGPALVAGHRYRLVIDGAWRDANGTPLAEGFEKQFVVGPPDHEPVDPAAWVIEPPRTGTRQPLVVTFPAPLDYGLMQRVIRVHDSDGEIAGVVTPGPRELSWSFTPDASWGGGPYELVVDRVLEDLAGNSVGRPFQVPIVDSAEPVGAWETAPLVRVPFEVER